MREYGLLFVAVFASLLLQRLAGQGVDVAANRLPAVLGPQLAGAVVYTALAMVAFTALYVAITRVSHSGRGLDWDGRLSLGGVTALVVFVLTYRLHGATSLPVVPDDIVIALLTGGVALGLVAVGYARIRGIDMHLAAPNRDALPTAGGVGLVAVCGGIWVGWCGRRRGHDAVRLRTRRGRQATASCRRVALAGPAPRSARRWRHWPAVQRGYPRGTS